MRISHKHKFVFIANQKTASSSIRTTLDEYSEISGVSDFESEYYYHTSAYNLKKHFETQSWDWDDYFKFSFVRNPWDSAVSHFFYRSKMLKETLANSDNQWLGSFFEDAYKSVGFPEWLKKVQGQLTFIDGDVSTQTDMVCDESGTSLLDFVGKFENIVDDFQFVCDTIGLTECELKLENTSTHSHYANYYTNSETKKLISDVYKSDIDMFGYSFDEN
jgi:hypothetical protein